MTISIPGEIFAYPGIVDLSAKMGWAAKFATSAAAPRSIDLALTADDFIGVIVIGALAWGANPGLTLHTEGLVNSVQRTGMPVAVANGAVAIGARITVAADGRFRTAIAGDRVIGRAESAAADGYTFSLNLVSLAATA